jgi:RNA 2',3'-cyclic 3'-phosphodiesterase
VADDVAAALGQVRQPGFEIALDGLGRFTGKNGPRALWAGVRPHEAVTHLHRKIDQALVRAGLDPERRAYLPHITLARIGRDTGPLDGFLARHAALTSAPFAISFFGLYESTLGRSGASYDLVERYALDPV